MKSIDIAIIEGDGIGAEVCQATQKALEAALPSAYRFDWCKVPGGAKHFLDTGMALPQDTVGRCLTADAIILGAAGLPGVNRADGTEAGQDVTLKLRKELELYANVRPIKAMPGSRRPPSVNQEEPIDYVIVRENCEGLYASRDRGEVINNERAVDQLVVTREGVKRIVRRAAEICSRRKGAPIDGVQRVTICDKANVLTSYAFFRSVAEETLSEYPDIEVEFSLIDAQSMYLISRPSHYDVIVTENMFGDILSDLGAATIGGLGLAPSAEIGTRHGLFQGAHGSAPDIAGKGIANPVATILSGALMLDWLGEKWDAPDLIDTSNSIKRAVENAMESGESLTPDLGGNGSTADFTKAIIARL